MRVAVKVTYCLGGCCLGDIRVWDDSQPWVLIDIRIFELLEARGAYCLGGI